MEMNFLISDISNALSWLEANPKTLKGIRRGIEREGLRISTNGSISYTSHPESFGSALTHKWITTDFAEALLELITPIDNNINNMFISLRDIHRYVVRHLKNEYLWPMSMPCFIDKTKSIKLAQYGSSNIGRMKTLYRKGLKNRYSTLMQIIAGIHYNFSFPLSFWKAYTGINNKLSEKEIISTGYLRLIRNYYRFGWIIPYLFGASPGMCPSFLNNYNNYAIDMPFKYAPSGLIYLPYATSLRLNRLGFISKSQIKLGITFNCLHEYVDCLKRIIKTPSVDYQRIGLQRDGHYIQLNTNILQTENELYLPIRPKSMTRNGESPSDALMSRGIEYVEVRSLDINPFSPVGIDKEQAYFLDIFLIWCTLVEVPEMSAKELLYTLNNWNHIILEGRKPGLKFSIDYGSVEQPLTNIGKFIFKDLRRIAKILDANNVIKCYQQVCDKLILNFDYPELTLSARFLNQLIEHGIIKLGITFANKHSQTLLNESLEILKEDQFNNERVSSKQRQHTLELMDKLSFDEFLENL